MVRTNATNYSSPGFAYATADADSFDRLDVAGQGQSLDTHDHSAGKGLPLAAGSIPNGSITSAMIADGTIAAADLAANSVTTAKIADGAATGAKLASDTARASLLVNGGLEIWQRGNGPFTAAAGYTADRWYIEGSTMSVSRDTTNADGGGVCAAATLSSASGALTQALNDQIPTLGVRTVTASLRVRTSTANAVRLRLDSSAGAGTPGAYHSGGGTYETLTVTATIPASVTTLTLRCLFDVACTAYIDNAMLVVGSVAADYAPLHPADDLARCLRYYELMGGAAAAFTTQWVATAAAQSDTRWVQLAFRKPIVPTVTKNGTWTANNCAQPILGAPTVNGFYISAQSSAAGNPYYQCADASATLSVEANP